MTLAAALETVDDIEEQSFYCDGSYTIGADKITCETGHGTQNLKQAFRNSCNCAFGEIALQVGAENMEKYAKAYGLTEGVTFDGITTADGNYEAVGAADANLAWSGIGQYKDQVNPCAFLIAILRTERPLKDYFLKKYISGLKTLLMTFLTMS